MTPMQNSILYLYKINCLLNSDMKIKNNNLKENMIISNFK